MKSLRRPGQEPSLPSLRNRSTVMDIDECNQKVCEKPLENGIYGNYIAQMAWSGLGSAIFRWVKGFPLWRTIREPRRRDSSFPVDERR